MMGMANMDFVIRECLAVVEGPLAMVRLGTCGAIQPPAHLGNFLVASQGSACVRYSHTLEQSHLSTVTTWWCLHPMLGLLVLSYSSMHVA